MRKKSQEELGTLVTREMKVMLQDDSLTKEQRFDLLAAVMFDAPVKNPLLASFAKSLKAGFDKVNESRRRGVESHRKAAKEEAARARAAKKKLQAFLDGENAQNNLPQLTTTDSQQPSIDINVGQLTTTSMQSKAKHNIVSPYKPPKGGRKEPDIVTPEDLMKKGGRRARRDGPSPRDAAESMAAALEGTEAFGHMRASERSLMRHLIPLVKKNSARLEEWRREVRDGLAAWTEAWRADDWQYAPGKITKWLADEKYLQPPRKKTAPAEGSGCGACGAEIV